MFDTVENQFTGIATNFILKSGSSDVTGFAANTGVILLNEIFQNPADDYNIVETAGIVRMSQRGFPSSAACLTKARLLFGLLWLAIPHSSGLSFAERSLNA